MLADTSASHVRPSARKRGGRKSDNNTQKRKGKAVLSDNFDISNTSVGARLTDSRGGIGSGGQSHANSEGEDLSAAEEVRDSEYIYILVYVFDSYRLEVKHVFEACVLTFNPYFGFVLYWFDFVTFFFWIGFFPVSLS